MKPKAHPRQQKAYLEMRCVNTKLKMTRVKDEVNRRQSAIANVANATMMGREAEASQDLIGASPNEMLL